MSDISISGDYITFQCPECRGTTTRKVDATVIDGYHTHCAICRRQYVIEIKIVR